MFCSPPARALHGFCNIMDYDTPSRVSSRNGQILPSQPSNSPLPHNYTSSHLCTPTYKKVAGSRTCRHQRKFIKCNGAKAQKADDQDVIRFTPLFGLTIAHEVFIQGKSKGNTSLVTCNAPLLVQERVSRIRFLVCSSKIFLQTTTPGTAPSLS